MTPHQVLELARQVLIYEPDTGSFRHAVRRSRTAVGGSAGSLDRNGYRRVSIGKTRVLAHRLAWALHSGNWPAGQIDHIDGCRSNNAIANLRDVDASTNQQNQHRARGASGYLWVSWKKNENRWRAAFRVRGAEITVGHFETAREAFEAAITRRRAMGLSVPIGIEGAPPVEQPDEAEPAKEGA